MKKTLTLLCLAVFLVSSCAGSNYYTDPKRVAQAFKKEGDAFRSQGNYAVALAKLLEAEKLSPEDPQIQNSLGLAYMGKKRFDLAETALKKAISLDPKYTEARNNLGAAYLGMNKWDQAIIQFKEVQKDLIYATPHFPLVNLGWAYLGKMDYIRAQSFFRKALNEKPGFIAAVHGLAQTYIQTQQIDRSKTLLHRYLHHQPDAAILQADLAQVYEALGQKKLALKTWQLVLKLVPNTSALARTAREKLYTLSIN